MSNKILNPYKNSDSNKRYYTYDYFLRQKFGSKCFKVPLNGGFTCPNIDGSKGTGGCTYCSSKGSGNFTDEKNLTIEDQFDITCKILHKKWQNALYIPYFQAFTNTYAPLSILREKYEVALSQPNVVGMNIATRADALKDDVIEYLHEISKRTFLTVELGLQTIHNSTAKHINRCHSYNEFLEGYKKLEGINVCIHIINGLPFEDKIMMLETAEEIAHLSPPPQSIKIHLLHILKGTKMADQYLNGDFDLLTRDDYVDIVCSQLEILPYDMVISRITGDGLANDLVAPLWGLKKLVVMNEIDKELVRRNSYQGLKFN